MEGGRDESDEERDAIPA